MDQPGDIVKHLLAVLVPGRTPADVYERAGYVAALEKAKTTYGSLFWRGAPRDAGWVLTAQPASLFPEFRRLGPKQMLSM